MMERGKGQALHNMQEEPPCIVPIITLLEHNIHKKKKIMSEDISIRLLIKEPPVFLKNE